MSLNWGHEDFQFDFFPKQGIRIGEILSKLNRAHDSLFSFAINGHRIMFPTDGEADSGMLYHHKDEMWYGSSD